MVTDYIFYAIDENKITVLQSYSKSIDNIDHYLLYHKLKLCGISSHTLEWFRSYLFGRLQAVHIGAKTSDFIPVTNGAPCKRKHFFYYYSIFSLTTFLPFHSTECWKVMLMTLLFPVWDLKDVMLTINKDHCTIATYFANPSKTKMYFQYIYRRCRNKFHLTQQSRFLERRCIQYKMLKILV